MGSEHGACLDRVFQQKHSMRRFKLSGIPLRGLSVDSIARAFQLVQCKVSKDPFLDCEKSCLSRMQLCLNECETGGRFMELFVAR